MVLRQAKAHGSSDPPKDICIPEFTVTQTVVVGFPMSSAILRVAASVNF